MSALATTTYTSLKGSLSRAVTIAQAHHQRAQVHQESHGIPTGPLPFSLLRPLGETFLVLSAAPAWPPLWKPCWPLCSGPD